MLKDQDNWGGHGSHHVEKSKCPCVPVMGNACCQHIVLQFQVCYTGDCLDPQLLHGCAWHEYNADAMQHVWEAEHKINAGQGNFIENITAMLVNNLYKPFPCNLPFPFTGSTIRFSPASALTKMLFAVEGLLCGYGKKEGCFCHVLQECWLTVPIEEP